MTLDFIFWLVHCSSEDVSFNSICLNVFEGIKQVDLLMWFMKTRLETPFKGDNVKPLVKTLNCENVVLFSLRKFRKLPHLLCFVFIFSDQTIVWKWFCLPLMIRYTLATL